MILYIPVYLIIVFILCIGLNIIIEYLINRSTESTKYRLTTYKVLATIAHMYSSRVRETDIPPTPIEVKEYLKSSSIGVDIPLSVIESLLRDIDKEKDDKSKEVEVGSYLYPTIFDLQKKYHLVLRVSYLIISVLIILFTIAVKS